MHLDSSTAPASSAHARLCHDDAAQELEAWTAEIALTVAGTLEPSCALAFCFGHYQSRRERRAAETSAKNLNAV